MPDVDTPAEAARDRPHSVSTQPLARARQPADSSGPGWPPTQMFTPTRHHTGVL